MTSFKDIINSKPDIILNPSSLNINEIERGVIFFYASWSPTIIQFRNLIMSLEKFPLIRLVVFDIDSDAFNSFCLTNDLKSSGNGETYWIKYGEVEAYSSGYSSGDMSKLILCHEKLLG